MTLEQEPTQGHEMSHLSTEDVVFNSPRRKIIPVPHPKTLEFFRVANELGIYSGIDEEARRLIEAYYFQEGARMHDLRTTVYPKTVQKVSRTIFGAMENMWDQLPDHIKVNLPKEQVLRKKHHSYTQEHMERMRKGPSDETRRKIGLSSKRNGFSRRTLERRLASVKGKHRPDPVRKEVSRKLKKRWEDPEFRSYMLTAIRNRCDDRSLWKVAQTQNLIPRMIEERLLTSSERETLQQYFKRKVRKNENIEKILDRFSIAVARLA